MTKNTSPELNFIAQLGKVFGASKTVEKGGAMYRGGYHELTLKSAPLSVKETKAKMRRVFKASGFRSQSGYFGKHTGNDGALQFFVIKGGHRLGMLACVDLEGSAAAPKISVTFGG